MKRFYNRSRSKSKATVTTERKFLQGLVFLICFSLFIVFIFGDHGLLKLYKIKQKRKKIQTNITQLRIEKEKATAEKNKIENDLDYIEKIAREKYKMVKPGEKIFKVIDN